MVNVKIVLLGNGGVGKTSIKRIFAGQRVDGKYTATIGADFTLKDFSYKTTTGETARLRFMIYDLAGQPRYDAVRRNYIMGAHAGVLVYDVTNRASLEEIPKWLIQFKAVIRQNVPLVLVGNKIDLRDNKDVQDTITTEEGKKMAVKLQENMGFGSRNKFFFIEVSALENIKVDQVFEFIAQNIYDKYISEGRYRI